MSLYVSRVRAAARGSVYRREPHTHMKARKRLAGAVYIAVAGLWQKGGGAEARGSSGRLAVRVGKEIQG